MILLIAPSESLEKNDTTLEVVALYFETKQNFLILFTSTEFICQHDFIIILWTWFKLLTEAASEDLDKPRLTHLSAFKLSVCWQLIIGWNL